MSPPATWSKWIARIHPVVQRETHRPTLLEEHLKCHTNKKLDGNRSQLLDARRG